MADFGHLLQESLAASGQAQIDQARALALIGCNPALHRYACAAASTAAPRCARAVGMGLSWRWRSASAGHR